MKTKLLSVFSIALLAITAFGQGRIVVNPVPVTNGITGTLADSSIVAGLYVGFAGNPEDSMLLVVPTTLVNGYAQFGSETILPVPAGTPMQFGVRAWSSAYNSYESAVASGLPSVLVGKSILLSATLGGQPTPPPLPSFLDFPGFTVYNLPEPSVSLLMLMGCGACAVWRSRFSKSPRQAKALLQSHS